MELAERNWIHVQTAKSKGVRKKGPAKKGQGKRIRGDAVTIPFFKIGSRRPQEEKERQGLGWALEGTD